MILLEGSAAALTSVPGSSWIVQYIMSRLNLSTIVLLQRLRLRLLFVSHRFHCVSMLLCCFMALGMAATPQQGVANGFVLDLGWQVHVA
jgi:hypothetical protein